MSYLRRASPLHAARASIGAAWCAALVAAAALTNEPLILAALALSTLLAAAASGVLHRVARSLLYSLPLAAAVSLVNALVARDGLTVLARFGDWGPFGEVDPTLEALCYGAVLGLELIVIVAVCALASAAVDPDELLRSMRRISFRSALTATLATRMVPLLALDAQRIGEAQRSRLHGASRPQVMRAVTTNALDRALDIAATLEVRGYAGAHRPPRTPRPLSRHDLAFAASATAITALAATTALLHLAPFRFYPTLATHLSARPIAIATAYLLLALLPFASKRGIEP
jgi:energy-coupling factor transport system permease protein